MNDATSSQPPTSAAFTGFQIRPPQPHELQHLLAFFSDNPLGNQHISALGAFGQPGDFPIGAVIIRPSGPQHTIGNFLVFVRPEFRRRKIGTKLMHQLYALAMTNRAEKLILPLLIHQDDPCIPFYRAMGLLPERSLATYSVEINRGLAFCDPLVARYQAKLTAQQIHIQPLATLDPSDIANFFSTHFGGFVDTRLADLRAGRYDLSLSCAAMRGNEIIASAMGRSRSDVPSVILDIILAAPPYRNGPLPLFMLAHSARLALQQKLTHCVFEADENHDHFAVNFARRLGAKPQWKRFCYSMSREQIQARIATAAI